ncbi:MAG TPA: type VI secretion system baseplate subunit TssE [Gemmatales bacterium]|nr:type VI secretion system baseplate subunit TssE [Gemmatales bacterium]HMP58489.1 type VI secretion system baseplate subunit TssE [Gemmatales bacterium]
MPPSEDYQPMILMPSIYDRLIDPASVESINKYGYSPQQMMEAVRRDLIDLLNTRQSDLAVDPRLTQVHGSVIGYGLPDLCTLRAETTDERENLTQVLQQIIERFEPRLTDVRVSIKSGADPKDRSINFHIEGKLSVDPAPEMAFDTELRLATGEFRPGADIK